MRNLDVALQCVGHEVTDPQEYQYNHLASWGKLTRFADLRGMLLVVLRLRGAPSSSYFMISFDGLKAYLHVPLCQTRVGSAS